MPVIARFGGIIIRLLCLGAVGHRLHAFHGDNELVVDLDELRILQGNASNRISRQVLAWARQHRFEILASLSRRRPATHAA